MPISLSPETEKLIEEQMRESGCPTADELVRVAIQTLQQTRGEDFEELDPELQAAIDEAEAQHAAGEGIPVDEAFAQLRRKYAGR